MYLKHISWAKRAFLNDILNLTPVNGIQLYLQESNNLNLCAYHGPKSLIFYKE